MTEDKKALVTLGILMFVFLAINAMIVVQGVIIRDGIMHYSSVFEKIENKKNIDQRESEVYYRCRPNGGKYVDNKIICNSPSPSPFTVSTP